MSIITSLKDTAAPVVATVWPALTTLGGLLHWLLNFAINWAVVFAAGYLLYKLGLKVFAYYQSLYIEGKPDEWVVVIRNGIQRQAGIGLNLIRHPDDEVAIFPSKVNKVSFSANNITQEYQGIEVSGTLVWTIFRDNDGPMKAYRYLGDDLRAEQPRHANNLIVSMAAAVVRNEIANTTIAEILKDRDNLRKMIKSKIGTVAQGWGIWLETIEITDVKVLSRTLFSDMQCDFREAQRKEAEFQKIENQYNVQVRNYEDRFAKEKKDSERRINDDLAEKEREKNAQARLLKDAKKRADIAYQNKQRDCQADLEKTNNSLEIARNQMSIQDKADEQSNEQRIRQLASELKTQMQRHANQLEQRKAELEMDFKASEAQNEIDRKQYAQTTEKMRDKVWFMNFRQKCIANVFENMSNSSTKFTFDSSKGQDALIMGMDNLINAQLSK